MAPGPGNARAGRYPGHDLGAGDEDAEPDDEPELDDPPEIDDHDEVNGDDDLGYR